MKYTVIDEHDNETVYHGFNSLMSPGAEAIGPETIVVLVHREGDVEVWIAEDLEGVSQLRLMLNAEDMPYTLDLLRRL